METLLLLKLLVVTTPALSWGLDTLANVGATASRTAGTYDIADSSGNGTTACVAVVVVAADGSATVTISEAGAWVLVMMMP